MLFGGKKIEEKNRIIQMLESEKVDLQKALSETESVNKCLKQNEADLKSTVQELIEKIQQISQALENSRENLEWTKSENNKARLELDIVRVQVTHLEKKICNINNEKLLLERDVEYYKKMSPEKYLKLGTDLFTLEKLTEILNIAQSESFIAIRKSQKKVILQKMINDIQILLCPIKTDKNLLKLLLRVGSEKRAIDIIKADLDAVTVNEIANAKAIEKKGCVLQKRIFLPQVKDAVYLIDAKNVDEYIRKIALGKLANVLYKIVNRAEEA